MEQGPRASQIVGVGGLGSMRWSEITEQGGVGVGGRFTEME